ncbi:hypothetical protein LWX53_04980 [bacterium]|nr:hypothetical protein [bacterium]
MSEFSYAVVSSILHDRAAVESIFSTFEPFFSGLGGSRVQLDRAAGGTPPFFFVLTGGTEGIVLEYLRSLPPRAAAKPFPLVLVAHARHNSLPAALEIAARARQEGGSAILIQLRSPDDPAAGASLREAVALSRAVAAMRSSRIGAVGEPSDWLIASSQGAPALAASWGAALESVDLGELTAGIEEVRRRDARERGGAAGATAPQAPLSEGMSAFIGGADYKREPAAEDFYKSDTIYRALRSLAERRGLDALTLRCFDILTLDGSTGCYALSRLADDGIDAGCEGDVPSIVALRWMRLLTGKPAWMANPSEIVEDGGGGRGKILLAHCTVPKSLLERYGVRSHFESGKGVAVAGKFAPCPVTLARIGGVGLDEAWIAEGWLESSPSDEGLCRTQAVIRLDSGDIARFLAAPLGNHIVVGFGSCAAAARRYLALEHLREI